MFSSEFTICDVAPESEIIFLLSCSWFDVFVINSSSKTASSVTLFADYFYVFFFLIAIFFFVIVHFSIIVFLLVISVLAVL